MTKATKDKSGKSTYFVPVTGRCRRNMLRQDVKQFKIERYMCEAARRAKFKKITEHKRETQLNDFVSKLNKIKNWLSPANFLRGK